MRLLSAIPTLFLISISVNAMDRVTRLCADAVLSIHQERATSSISPETAKERVSRILKQAGDSEGPAKDRKVFAHSGMRRFPRGLEDHLRALASDLDSNSQGLSIKEVRGKADIAEVSRTIEMADSNIVLTYLGKAAQLLGWPMSIFGTGLLIDQINFYNYTYIPNVVGLSIAAASIPLIQKLYKFAKYNGRQSRHETSAFEGMTADRTDGDWIFRSDSLPVTNELVDAIVLGRDLEPSRNRLKRLLHMNPLYRWLRIGSKVLTHNLKIDRITTMEPTAHGELEPVLTIISRIEPKAKVKAIDQSTLTIEVIPLTKTKGAIRTPGGLWTYEPNPVRETGDYDFIYNPTPDFNDQMPFFFGGSWGVVKRMTSSFNPVVSGRAPQIFQVDWELYEKWSAEIKAKRRSGLFDPRAPGLKIGNSAKRWKGRWLPAVARWTTRLALIGLLGFYGLSPDALEKARPYQKLVEQTGKDYLHDWGATPPARVIFNPIDIVYAKEVVRRTNKDFAYYDIINMLQEKYQKEVLESRKAELERLEKAWRDTESQPQAQRFMERKSRIIEERQPIWNLYEADRIMEEVRELRTDGKFFESLKPEDWPRIDGVIFEKKGLRLPSARFVIENIILNSTLADHSSVGDWLYHYAAFAEFDSRADYLGDQQRLYNIGIPEIAWTRIRELDAPNRERMFEAERKIQELTAHPLRSWIDPGLQEGYHSRVKMAEEFEAGIKKIEDLLSNSEALRAFMDTLSITSRGNVETKFSEQIFIRLPNNASSYDKSWNIPSEWLKDFLLHPQVIAHPDYPRWINRFKQDLSGFTDYEILKPNAEVRHLYEDWLAKEKGTGIVAPEEFTEQLMQKLKERPSNLADIQ